RLSGVSNGRTTRLLGPGGTRFKSNRTQDAEGLGVYGAKGTEGQLLVAFERRERILRYNFGRHGFRAQPKTIRLPRDARKAEYNKELEAVGRFGKGTKLSGTIIAFSERFLDARGNIRGWLIGGRRPGPIAVRRSDDFDITDLAILPGGDVLILERSFSVIKLAGMRIRRIAHKDIKPKAVLDGEVLVEAGQPARTIDNMEGIAVHRSPKGELRISIISDDNFNPLQRTLLLQFALVEE
ncbi:MAG: esterase-like activity of phytase family protein, partial [Hyphomicrobiales bacterium]